MESKYLSDWKDVRIKINNELGRPIIALYIANPDYLEQAINDIFSFECPELSFSIKNDDTIKIMLSSGSSDFYTLDSNYTLAERADIAEFLNLSPKEFFLTCCSRDKQGYIIFPDPLSNYSIPLMGYTHIPKDISLN